MKRNLSQDRSYQFALDVIQLYLQLQKRREFVLSKQLLRSGTSIGANVEEAVGAQSKRDFISKMAIASKEARETHYWLRLFRDSKICPNLSLTALLSDSEELIRILTSIVKTGQEKLKGQS